MKNMKIIIAGSRDFKPSFKIEEQIDQIISLYLEGRQIVIVSGTARGADQYGESYANKRKYRLERYPADWDKYGKKAGYIRNNEMALIADMAIVIWDSKSKGSKHMIEAMKKLDKRVEVIFI